MTAGAPVLGAVNVAALEREGGCAAGPQSGTVEEVMVTAMAMTMTMAMRMKMKTIGNRQVHRMRKERPRLSRRKRCKRDRL